MTALPIVPTLDHETAFWRAGLRLVAGVDEVGRGAMAGPLLAAAVILPDLRRLRSKSLRAALAQIRDSKLLPPVRREALVPFISDVALAVGIGIVEVEELDAIGMGPANRLVMERAVATLPVAPEAVLLDAMVVELDHPQVGLIDGDARSLTIAAASIVAKVARDRLMVECHSSEPRFRFDVHKGYATSDHLAALREYGPCVHHRRCFGPVARRLSDDPR